MGIRTLLFGLAPIAALAQGPEITSWIINPGTETGYGGSLTNVLQVAYTPNDVYVRCSCIPGYDIGPWTGNPNDAMNMDFVFKITRSPQPATGPHTATPMGHIGVWRNGVSIFNAKDGFSYNNQGIWNRDALVFEGLSFDACMGHPAPNGEYHHHVTPNCLYDHMNEVAHSDLIGFAFDGYPVYGAYGFANPDGTVRRGAHGIGLSAARHHQPHHPARRHHAEPRPIWSGHRRPVPAGRLPGGL
jgi:hypothetical protein